jgi:hypothetical protein
LAAAKIARLRAIEADPTAAEANGPLDLTLTPEDTVDAAAAPIPSIPTP